MCQQIRIRPAVTADREPLHRILTATWLTVWAPHCRPESVARFRREDPVARQLDEDLPLMRVANAGCRVVGMTCLAQDHLLDLHVDPAEWGRGIGRALMADAEAAGAARLEVRAFNHRAIRLYERRGWRRTGVFEATELGTPVTTYTYRLDRGGGGAVSASPR